MHDYHTGTPGSFEQTVIGLRRARAERIPVGLTTVITRSNFRHAQEIVRVAHATGARAVHFALAAPHGRAAELRDRVIPPRELAMPYLSRAVAEAQRLGLATVVEDGPSLKASAPSALDFFAGMGIAAPALESNAAPPQRRVALRVVASSDNHETGALVKRPVSGSDDSSPTLARAEAPGG
jgi:hypothetical protein